MKPVFFVLKSKFLLDLKKNISGSMLNEGLSIYTTFDLFVLNLTELYI